MSSAEISLNLPKSKLNDTSFIREKLLEVSLNTLKEISKYTDKNFLELVRGFITDLKESDEAFLKKWDLTYDMIFQKPENSMVDEENTDSLVKSDKPQPNSSVSSDEDNTNQQQDETQKDSSVSSDEDNTNQQQDENQKDSSSFSDENDTKSVSVNDTKGTGSKLKKVKITVKKSK